MANLRIVSSASGFSKLIGICRREFSTNSVSTLQKWNLLHVGGQRWRMLSVNRCYGNEGAEKSSVSKPTHQYSSQHTTEQRLTSWLHFRKRFIGTLFAKRFSASATFSAEQGKDRAPPDSQTATETTPKGDGPTLIECASPQAAVRWWSAAFSGRGIPEAEVSAEYLVAHALGYKQLHEVTSRVLESRLIQSQLDQINRLCARRKERVPVQYIVGDWDFRDITLTVRPPVFIPRPETEMLVDVILANYPEDRTLHFLEIGCGSGAISISVLKEMPLVHLTAIDCSEGAVQLTTENANRLGVQDRLTVYHAAMTSDLPRCLRGQQPLFDAIISNPPYIPTQDMEELAPEIKLHEDLGALCGGPDGLDLIKNILRNARHLLAPGGSIWLETDARHPEDIQAWLADNRETGVGFVRAFQDYNDRPRFSQLTFQP